MLNKRQGRQELARLTGWSDNCGIGKSKRTLEGRPGFSGA